MELIDLMDAIAVHALAAADTAGGADFHDVAVGFPAGRGRCVRIFYDGERLPEHFLEGTTLNSRLMAESIHIRGYWPSPETSSKRQRIIEHEMATFVKSLRTRILGDSQLGGGAADLNLSPALVNQVTVANSRYVTVDLEAVVDYSEYTIAP